MVAKAGQSGSTEYPVELQEPLGFANGFTPLSAQEEYQQCKISERRKSSGSKALIASALCAVGMICPVWAQQPAERPAASPGFSFEQFRSFFDGVRDGVAAAAYGPYVVWNYLVANPPAAVMLSALLATSVAVLSIRHQRATTRLRETFNTLNESNWDKDVIEARQKFKSIKDSLTNGHDMARYAKPTDENEISSATTLFTILNDYENMALGVKMNIIDEPYLYRWMRGVVLSDWDSLQPLVTAARTEHGNPFAFVEFEGLTIAWSQGVSYINGRPLKKAVKKIHVN